MIGIDKNIKITMFKKVKKSAQKIICEKLHGYRSVHYLNTFQRLR